MEADGPPTGTRDGDSPSPPRAAGTRAPAATARPPAELSAASRAPRSRRRLLLGGLAIGVLVLAGATAAALTGGVGGPRAAEPTPEVVVLPSPTPTIAPVARTPVSPFADSLPAGVLGFALTGVTDHRPLLLAGALEGYRLDYSDGGTTTLTVLAGQWPTAEEARTAYAELVAAAGAPAPDGEPTTGDVLVDGAVVGNWTATTPGDGIGAVTWSNGTAVLQLTGPADVVRDAYTAFPY